MQVTRIPTGMLQANSYVVVDEETKKGFVVDLGGYSKRMKSFVENENIEIEYIILTHGHGDHICGVPGHLEDWPDAKVVAAEAELPLLTDPALNLARDTGGTDVIISPDLLVNDMDTLQVGNLVLRFFLTPGHTKGGMCIYVESEGVLFSGDTLFQASIGRTDFYGGSFPEIKKSIKTKLYVLPDETRVFPGHMGPTTIGFEKENNPFVF